MSSHSRYGNAIPAGAEDSDSDDDIWCSSRPSGGDLQSQSTAVSRSDPYSDICTLPGGNQRSIFAGVGDSAIV